MLQHPSQKNASPCKASTQVPHELMYKKVSVKILQVRTVLSILEIFDAYSKSAKKHEKNAMFWYCVCSLEMVPGTGIEPV